MGRAGKRVSTADRRNKVVEVTLRLVADEGIDGATTARIAAAAGVAEGTLYRMFGNKRGILLAAVDKVHQNFFDLMAASRKENPLETLRELGRLHTASMVASGVDHFIAPLFACMTAPAHTGLREAMAKGQQKIIDAYVEILEDAKARGFILPTTDVRQVAWMLTAVFWTEDLSSLVGMPGFVLEGRSAKALDSILRYIEQEGGRAAPISPDSSVEQ